MTKYYIFTLFSHYVTLLSLHCNSCFGAMSLALAIKRKQCRVTDLSFSFDYFS